MEPTRIVPIISKNSAERSIVVQGNMLDKCVCVGVPYTMLYTFTSPYIRQEGQFGGVRAISTGRLQIRNWIINYDRTGYFDLEVITQGRGPATYTVDAEGLLASGSEKFLIAGKNDRTVISIRSDKPYPVRIVSAEWEGYFTSHSRSIG